MTVDNIYQKIAAIASKEPSGWLKDAQWRSENRAWLKHSQAIALRILRTLRAKNISQKELAEKIGVSPQQVNKIVKGKENLTLETIAKLETALGVSLINAPLYQTSLEVSYQIEQNPAVSFSASITPGFKKTAISTGEYIEIYRENSENDNSNYGMVS
jgi:transcriptional regulator with XRE-family HTH domain